MAVVHLCQFSGFKIYPGKGKLYVRSDSRSFRFINGKNESYFLQRLKPSRLDWTVVYRRLHKKGAAEETSKKRSRKAVKVQKDIVGASLEAIKAKRNQKPEAREAERAKIAAAAKEKKKEEATKKKELKKKDAPARAAQAKISKLQAKGAGTKVKATSR